MSDNLTSKEFQDKVKSGEIVNTKKGLVTKALLQPELSKDTTDVLMGNVKVKNAHKVDFNLQRIKTSIPIWRKDHPEEMYFDSAIEGAFYHYLKQNNIDFTYKEKITIIGKFKYYNEDEASLSWIPDFKIWNPGMPLIIIDTKGYPNESFPVKLKILMFKFFLLQKEQQLIFLPHIWFVKNKGMFPVALNCINRILKGEKLDGIETVLLFNEQKKKKKKK